MNNEKDMMGGPEVGNLNNKAVKGGMEKLFSGSKAHLEVKQGRVVVALDLKNAFGSMSRGTMYQDMTALFPELAPLLSKLYHGDTPLVWADCFAELHEFAAHTGIDAGCPFSVICFCVGLRRLLGALMILPVPRLP